MSGFTFNAMRDMLGGQDRRLRELERYAASARALPWTPWLTAPDNGDAWSGNGWWLRYNDLLIAGWQVTVGPAPSGTPSEYYIGGLGGSGMPPLVQAGRFEIASGWWGERVPASTSRCFGRHTYGSTFITLEGLGSVLVSSYLRLMYQSAYPVGNETFVTNSAPWAADLGDKYGGWFIHRVPTGQ